MKKKLFMIGIVIAILVAIAVIGTGLHQKIITTPSLQPSSSQALTLCKQELQSKVINPNFSISLDKLGISTCYNLKLTIDSADEALVASAEISFSNLLKEDLPDLVFRLFPNSPLIYGGAMDLTQVTVNDENVETEYLLERTAIKLNLATPLKSQQSTIIKFVYKIKLPEETGATRVYGVFRASRDQQILTMANWYPILAVRQNNQWLIPPVDGIGDAVTSRTALYIAEITAPAEWKIATTGVEIETEQNGTNIFHKFMSGPTRDFMVVASPNFVSESRMINGIKITQWGLSTTKTGWKRSLDVAAASMKEFSNNYGLYPYTEVDIVAVPLTIAIGVEYPGLFLISEKSYQNTVDSDNELTVVVAHEMAHQWWYSSVGNDVTLNPWQDEALTTFSTFDFLKTYNPNIYSYLQNSYQQRVNTLEQSRGVESFSQPTSAFTSRPSDYSTLIYIKGALFFNTLKEKIGSNVFLAALNSYYKNYVFDLAQPKDLLDVFPSACKCDLSSFYKTWGLGY